MHGLTPHPAASSTIAAALSPTLWHGLKCDMTVSTTASIAGESTRTYAFTKCATSPVDAAARSSRPGAYIATYILSIQILIAVFFCQTSERVKLVRGRTSSFLIEVINTAVVVKSLDMHN